MVVLKRTVIKSL